MMVITRKTLETLLKRSCPSKDDTRRHLMALRFEGSSCVSTDGHRIHVLPVACDGEITANVPVWAIQAALAALDKDQAPIGITALAGKIAIDFPGRDGKNTIRTHGDSFPPWQQVTSSGAPEATLAGKISGLLKLARGIKAEAIVFVGQGNCKVAVFAEGDPGNVVVVLECDQSWSGRVGLNPRYLVDGLMALKSTGSTECTLDVHGELEPVKLEGNSGGVVVIMPRRV
jgi:DNA polymerase III sliding clamp (beta) subunit (PCNA family)